MAPIILLGGASLGTVPFSNPDEVKVLLETSAALKVNRIDTAARYPSGQSGRSEELIGAALPSGVVFEIDTKAMINDPAGSLTSQAITESLETSIGRLNHEINTFYFHAFDPETPLSESLKTINDHYNKGHFKKFGICNFTAAQVEQLVAICHREGYIMPSVYQGHYNALFRQSEEDILPILRKHGISFIAYSPLAGGFLTGSKTLTPQMRIPSRFDLSNPFGAGFRATYDTPPMHDAIRTIHRSLIEAHGSSSATKQISDAKLVGTGQAAGEETSITMTEASLRWLMHHSALDGDKGDGFILGTSSVDMLKNNVDMTTRGPLDKGIVDGFESAWKIILDGKQEVK